jgi:DNA-binding SARP family transcriptional activator
LRQALWQLQSALGSQNEPGTSRVLSVEPDWVQLNSEADIWLDVAVFEQAYNLVQKTPGQDLNGSQAQLLQDTVQLYQGPLLEGWYQDWCLLERERLQSMYLAMLDKLMSYYEAHDDYETSLLYGMHIMCYDRARERTHRRMMRLYYLTGDRAEALRQYERCAGALEEELGVSPSKSTIAIYRQIQADQLDEPEHTLTPTEANTAIDITVPLLFELLEHFTQFQRAISDLQNQLQKSTQTMELALNHNALHANLKPSRQETLL